MGIGRYLSAVLGTAALLLTSQAGATKYLELKVIDKDYLCVHFRDGEVRYRDSGTGESAYLGHPFVEGDDTLVVFGRRLDPAAAAEGADYFLMVVPSIYVRDTAGLFAGFLKKRNKES